VVPRSEIPLKIVYAVVVVAACRTNVKKNGEMLIEYAENFLNSKILREVSPVDIQISEIAPKDWSVSAAAETG
jgi:hypothetical protein